MDKSSIHFAKGVSGGIREEIMETLDVHNEALSEKYLGMPTDVGTATNGAFKYLKDRVWKKVRGGWSKHCQLVERKCSSRQWHKWCQPSPCLASDCREGYVSISIV